MGSTVMSGLEGKGGAPTRRRQWQLLEKHQTPGVPTAPHTVTRPRTPPHLLGSLRRE